MKLVHLNSSELAKSEGKKNIFSFFVMRASINKKNIYLKQNNDDSFCQYAHLN